MPAKTLVAGNWKMNGLFASLAEVEALAAALRRQPAPCRVALMPPATLIHAAAQAAAGVIEIGAQDLSPEACGAHTGDLNGELLHDAGARLVILGHSERRHGHGETDAQIAAKVEAALRCGLEPVICVGETAEQHAAGETLDVVRAQVRGSLPPSLEGQAFALAYEPVWAIGSGRTPSTAEIAEVHAALVEAIAGFGGMAPVLYGGSVKGDNAREILALPGVGGALVGGASLKADDFLPIVRAAA
jgi:triosephosphate isomerase (TIM)